MSSSGATEAWINRPRPALARNLQHRELAGVCAGLAAHLGLDVRIIRVFFIAATPFAGAGALVYGFLWITLAGRTSGVSAPGTQPGPAGRLGLPSSVTMVGLGAAVVLTALVANLSRHQGWDLDLHIWLPLAAVGVGVLVVWAHLGETTRDSDATERLDGAAAIRIAAGGVLAVLGLLLLLTTGRSWGEAANALLAALVILAGMVVLVTPWLVRLWRDLRAEQAERVRANERADIAAHLHDSVLQTFALIQRSSADPARVTRLARAQERELRRWLFTDADPEDDTLVAAVQQTAAEVEDRHDVSIEVILLGDQPVGERQRALVAALREALVNAARHGREPVSAYIEVGPTQIEAFVRDHGAGFDLGEVPDDRLGVRESIIGRMERAGGRATIRRLDGGTEVHLVMPSSDNGPIDHTSPAEATPPTGAEA